MLPSRLFLLPYFTTNGVGLSAIPERDVAAPQAKAEPANALSRLDPVMQWSMVKFVGLDEIMNCETVNDGHTKNRDLMGVIWNLLLHECKDSEWWWDDVPLPKFVQI